MHVAGSASVASFKQAVGSSCLYVTITGLSDELKISDLIFAFIMQESTLTRPIRVH